MLSRAKVDPRRPGLILKVGLGRCRTNSIRVYVDWNRPGAMSRGVRPGQCLGESARADDERSHPRSMSSRAGLDRSRLEIDLGRCRLKSTWADVEASLLWPMTSGVGPG